MDDRVSLEEKLELLGWVARCDGLEAVAASWRHQAALLYSLTGVCVCVCVCVVVSLFVCLRVCHYYDLPFLYRTHQY